jgi:protein gp37
MKPEWAKDIRDRCFAAGIPFFFKQWGGVNKKRNGRTLEGRTWNGMPQSSEWLKLNYV